MGFSVLRDKFNGLLGCMQYLAMLRVFAELESSLPGLNIRGKHLHRAAAFLVTRHLLAFDWTMVKSVEMFPTF